MRWGPAVLLAAAACGRVGFAPVSDSGAAIDASLADTNSAACASWGPFAAPIHVAELGSPTADDWDPSLTADGLLIVLYTIRPGGLGDFDLYAATRSSAQAPFEPPLVHLTEVSSSANDNSPHISPDGLTIVFASQRPGGLGNNDLWHATRSDRTAPFGVPTHLGAINSPAGDTSPWLSEDGLRLYFSSDRIPAASQEIYVTSRSSVQDAFGPPVRLTELSSNANERSVTLSADELEVFFSSDRLGNFEIYTASRASLASPFSTPRLVAELNTPNDEVGMHLSADGRTMFFNYDTDTGGTLDAEIWATTRSCLD
jgi:Tol biopolymer transport system component